MSSRTEYDTKEAYSKHLAKVLLRHCLCAWQSPNRHSIKAHHIIKGITLKTFKQLLKVYGGPYIIEQEGYFPSLVIQEFNRMAREVREKFFQIPFREETEIEKNLQQTSVDNLHKFLRDLFAVNCYLKRIIKDIESRSPTIKYKYAYGIYHKYDLMLEGETLEELMTMFYGSSREVLQKKDEQ